MRVTRNKLRIIGLSCCIATVAVSRSLGARPGPRPVFFCCLQMIKFVRAGAILVPLLQVIELLLQAGARPDEAEMIKGQTPLFAAIRKKHTAAVQKLTEAGKKHTAAVQKLPEAGKEHTAAVQKLTEAGKKHTAAVQKLTEAGKKHTAAVQKLTEAGKEHTV